MSGSFSGDTTTVPVLLASTGSGTFTESKAPTTLTYTGSTSVTSGHTPSPLGHAHDGGRDAHFRADRHLHRRYGRLGPALQRHHELGRERQLQHLQLQPERQPAAGHRELRRQQRLLHVGHVGLRDREHPDLALGQCGHGHLRSEHDGDGHPDQCVQRVSDQRPDDHAGPQRQPVVQRHHREHRQGLVLHHAERERGDLHPERLCSPATRRPLPVPGGQHRFQPLRGQRGADQPELHRSDLGHRPASRSPTSSEPHQQRLGTERPARHHDAGDGALGAEELHGHDDTRRARPPAPSPTSTRCPVRSR